MQRKEKIKEKLSVGIRFALKNILYPKILQGKRSKNVLFTFDETILRGSLRV